MERVNIWIENKFYTIEEPYWGGIVKLVLSLEKGLARKKCPEGYIPLEASGDAEILKPYIQLRVEGLKLVKEVLEYSLEEVEEAARDVISKEWGLEVPNFEEGEGYQKYIEIKERNKETAEFNKKVTYPLTKKLKELNLYSFDQLDWLDYFHIIARNHTLDMLSDSLIARLGLTRRSKKYPNLKDEYILPELLDWEFYLTIRGKIPKGLHYWHNDTEGGEIQFSRLLEVLYNWEKQKFTSRTAKEWLLAHPDAIEQLVIDRKIPQDAPIALVTIDKLVRVAEEIFEKDQLRKIIAEQATKESN